MTTEVKQNHLEALIKTFKMMIRISRSQPNTPRSRVIFYQLLTEYFTRILNAHDSGKMIVAHPVFFPSEILYAMDLVPMHTETTTWLDALFLKEQPELLSKGAEIGLSQEICSPHRGVAGIFGLQKITKPDILLWSNLICDNSAKFGELIMELNRCPGFFLDNPFQKSPAEFNYLVGELKEMIAFLEHQTGRKIDYVKLSESVERMNHEIELYREISELRKNIPTPLSISGFLELLSADYLFPGQPEASLYLTTLRDELKVMVQEKKGAVNPERYRLMTLFIPPLHLLGYLSELFAELGAASVAEPLFTIWSPGQLDPERPLESIAIKSFLIPERRSMYGPLTKEAIDDITRSAEEYKADGAIFWAFIGCRHTCATIKIIKDALNEIDVPMLTMDCDIVDSTVNSKEDTRAKIEQFIELLEDR